MSYHFPHCGQIDIPHMHGGVDCDTPHPCDCGGATLVSLRHLGTPDEITKARLRALEACAAFLRSVPKLRLLDEWTKQRKEFYAFAELPPELAELAKMDGGT